MSSIRAASSSRLSPRSLHPTWRIPVWATDSYTARASAIVSSSRVSMKMNSGNGAPKLSDKRAQRNTRQPGVQVDGRVSRASPGAGPTSCQTTDTVAIRQREEGEMRAAVWNGPGTMSVGSTPDAACPEDGALLRVLACGICGTDVRSFYKGDRRISPPWVLGHEISGELVEIGP